MKFNLVIPMAGRGQRFVDAGYTDPKPFISVGGRAMISCVTSNLTAGLNDDDYPYVTWIAQAEHEEKARYYARGSNAKVVTLNGVTEGAACTVLSASYLFNDTLPLVIANSDQVVEDGLHDFLQAVRFLDGGIMAFKATDPKWSYARLGPDGYVAEVAEKLPVSPWATVGIYYFRQGKDFVTAASRMIEHNHRMRGEFYVAPAYNELILEGAKIGLFELDAAKMHGLGTPEDLQAYIKARYEE